MVIKRRPNTFLRLMVGNAGMLLATVSVCLCILQPLSAQSRLYPHEFDLDAVTLLDGPFKKALLLNDSVLLAYDVDRLLQPYQKQAGIRQTGKPFINWSGEMGNGLDGHVGGHYLTALSMAYAATRDEVLKSKLKSKLDYVLAELTLCQNAVTDTANLMYGYVGGVPSSTQVWTALFNKNMTNYNNSWVPWYNVHKTYAGLRDAWLYTGNETARTMFLKLCDWGVRITSPLSDAQMQLMLDKEYGGMNEVYADAYQMTGKTAYLTAAKRFSHKVLYDNMRLNSATYLDGKHANTQIPKVIGFERVAQLDPTATIYHTASVNFWKNVVEKRTLALGGNSVSEHFLSAANCVKYTTEREGPESCNTYNMLKLTENLFAVNQEAAYADYYERALFNHILSTQHPEHGGYVYFTSARPQHYKVYSQVNQAMWCCVGSGMENHGKYGQFIYSRHHNDSLFVNLFVASELNWSDQQVVLKQTTRFPYEQATTLTLTRPANVTDSFTLLVRHPKWVVANDFAIQINGTTVDLSSTPGSYVALRRPWANGDVIRVALPMRVACEPMPNYTTYVALTYGPILLGAKTGDDNLVGLLAGEGRMEHVATGPYQTLTSAPILIGNRVSLPDSVELVNADSLHFRIKGFYNSPRFNDLYLQPFATIHDSRYMMYWWQLTKAQYESVRASVEKEEALLLELDNRTIDQVKPGEQQSESDHFMQGDETNNGLYSGTFYRDATNGGWFGYRLLTKGFTDSVSLMVRYYGKETGLRSFHIVIDGDTLTGVNLANKWKTEGLISVEYPLPSALLAGKDTISVVFDALPGHTAGGVFGLRLLNGRRVEPLVSYRFTASDWGVCDAGRAPASVFSYDYVNNTFSITKSGNNNICFMMNAAQNNVYSVSSDKTFFLIKGKNLKTTAGSSYIWWFNGFNNGGSTAPTYTITGATSNYLLWQVPGTASLATNMNYTQPFMKVTNNGTSFINAIGLTTSAVDYRSTIEDINFYSAEEAAAFYPEVAATLGITGTTVVRQPLNGVRVYTLGGGQLKVESDRDANIRLFDISGRLVKAFHLVAEEERSLRVRPGVYMIEGKKIVVR